MSTLKTNNIEHLDASTPSIQTTIGGGTILAGVSTVSGTLSVGTGTSISSPATNELALGTNDVERLRITSDGKIGIGTNSPGTILDARGNIQFGDGGGFDMNILGTRHQFSINGSEKVRITSGGEVQIANGNLKFSTSGTGIDFSATSDGSGTATSEVLDDYEEGSWTPSIIGSSTAGTYETDDADGWYRKVGDVVYFSFRVDLSDTVTGGGSGSALVSGLPYTVVSNSPGPYRNNGSQQIVAYMYRVPVSRDYAKALPRHGLNTMLILSYDNSSGGAVNQTIEDISIVTTTGTDRVIGGGGFYIAA